VNLVPIATSSEVPDGLSTAAMSEGVDLVIVRRGEEHSVLHGRCLHRGALLADGTIVGDALICGLHGWDYRIESGVSAYNNSAELELARACDRDHLRRLCIDDLTTFNRDMHDLTGIDYGGVRA
jgi:nitrite reductase/ring-hydroxylating ferredoxin subunit